MLTVCWKGKANVDRLSWRLEGGGPLARECGDQGEHLGRVWWWGLAEVAQSEESCTELSWWSCPPGGKDGDLTCSGGTVS